MTKIYIALVDTPGVFASLIRTCTKQKYVHVALSLDPLLEETYSVGRRNPFIPLIAGFTRESKQAILHKYPNARYRILSLECSDQQRRALRATLRRCYLKRFSYHYCITGLPLILFQKPFEMRNHFTCSSFAAKVLQDEKIMSFDKHFSIVTPKDFMRLESTELLFEGYLHDYIALQKERRSDERAKEHGFWKSPLRYITASITHHA